MRYPFVLLDIGETLVGPRDSFGAVYAQELARMGLEVPAERLERGLREVWEELDRLVPRGVDRYDHFPGGEAGYWHRFAATTLLRATGEPADDAFIAELLRRLRRAFRDTAAWQVYPDVPPALDALREAGVRLGVVSNWDSRLPGLLEDLGLAPYFETLGVSHIEGVEKPDPALFECVLERLGARPEQALHVGDVPELDMGGAHAAGVDALLVDRRGKIDGAHPAVTDLSDLPRIVRDGARGNPVLRPAR
jgi:putative hydrolase of the HAD superfamily